LAKNIDITDIFNSEKPTIQIGEKKYEVDNSLKAVLAFEQLTSEGTSFDTIQDVLKTVLGDKVIEELNLVELSLDALKVLMIAAMAAVQGMEYSEAEARFQKAKAKQ